MKRTPKMLISIHKFSFMSKIYKKTQNNANFKIMIKYKWKITIKTIWNFIARIIQNLYL